MAARGVRLLLSVRTASHILRNPQSFNGRSLAQPAHAALHTARPVYAQEVESSPPAQPDFESPEEFIAFYKTALEKTEAPDAVKRMLKLDLANQRLKNKFEKHEIIDKFQRAPGDTGSTEVQIAVLSHRIKYLTAHMSQHRKDVHSRRGLLDLVQQRRTMLKYLKRKNYHGYIQILDELSIRAVR